MSKVFIVILHIGDLDVTKRCIDSLEKYEKNFQQVVVVNNDTSILSQKDFASSRVTVINNKKNLGFSGGVNVGITYAMKNGADAVVLLNNDSYIKKPFITALSKVLSSHSAVGVVGPAICFEKSGKKVFDIGGKVSMLTGKTQHNEVESVKEVPLQFVDYITGAAMMIRKEVFENSGFFDEDFFLYYEDADFCLRAREEGYKIAVDPSVVVHHLLSKTIGKVTPFAVYHQTKSLVVFGKKYMKSPLQRLFHVLFLLYQTSSITFKHPIAGVSGWKAVLE